MTEQMPNIQMQEPMGQMHTCRHAVLRISSLDLQSLWLDAEFGTPNAESNARPVLIPRRRILNLEISLTHFTTPGKFWRIHKEFLTPDADPVILAACPKSEIGFTHLDPLNLIHRIMIHDLMLASCRDPDVTPWVPLSAPLRWGVSHDLKIRRTNGMKLI